MSSSEDLVFERQRAIDRYASLAKQSRDVAAQLLEVQKSGRAMPPTLLSRIAQIRGEIQSVAEREARLAKQLGEDPIISPKKLEERLCPRPETRTPADLVQLMEDALAILQDPMQTLENLSRQLKRAEQRIETLTAQVQRRGGQALPPSSDLQRRFELAQRELDRVKRELEKEKQARETLSDYNKNLEATIKKLEDQIAESIEDEDEEDEDEDTGFEDEEEEEEEEEEDVEAQEALLKDVYDTTEDELSKITFWLKGLFTVPYGQDLDTIPKWFGGIKRNQTKGVFFGNPDGVRIFSEFLTLENVDSLIAKTAFSNFANQKSSLAAASAKNYPYQVGLLYVLSALSRRLKPTAQAKLAWQNFMNDIFYGALSKKPGLGLLYKEFALISSDEKSAWEQFIDDQQELNDQGSLKILEGFLDNLSALEIISTEEAYQILNAIADEPVIVNVPLIEDFINSLFVNDESEAPIDLYTTFLFDDNISKKERDDLRDAVPESNSYPFRKGILQKMNEYLDAHGGDPNQAGIYIGFVETLDALDEKTIGGENALETLVSQAQTSVARKAVFDRFIELLIENDLLSEDSALYAAIEPEEEEEQEDEEEEEDAFESVEEEEDEEQEESEEEPDVSELEEEEEEELTPEEQLEQLTSFLRSAFQGSDNLEWFGGQMPRSEKGYFATEQAAQRVGEDKSDDATWRDLWYQEDVASEMFSDPNFKDSTVLNNIQKAVEATGIDIEPYPFKAGIFDEIERLVKEGLGDEALRSFVKNVFLNTDDSLAITNSRRTRVGSSKSPWGIVAAVRQPVDETDEDEVQVTEDERVMREDFLKLLSERSIVTNSGIKKLRKGTQVLQPADLVGFVASSAHVGGNSEDPYTTTEWDQAYTLLEVNPYDAAATHVVKRYANAKHQDKRLEERISSDIANLDDSILSLVGLERR